MVTISLCLLTMNELEGCRVDAPLIDKDKFEDVYVIDGNSVDGTKEYLESLDIKVYGQDKKGLNAACVQALTLCRTEFLVFFHPKRTIPVTDLYKFRQYFEEGNDLVIGSRNIKGAINEEDGRFLKPRKWFVNTIAVVAALLFKKKGPIIWDVLHGFRGMNSEKFRTLNIPDYGSTVDLAMVIRSYSNNFRIIEFPTKEGHRIAGETHFKTLPTGWGLIKFLVREKFGKS